MMATERHTFKWPAIDHASVEIAICERFLAGESIDALGLDYGLYVQRVEAIIRRRMVGIKRKWD